MHNRHILENGSTIIWYQNISISTLDLQTEGLRTIFFCFGNIPFYPFLLDLVKYELHLQRLFCRVSIKIGINIDSRNCTTVVPFAATMLLILTSSGFSLSLKFDVRPAILGYFREKNQIQITMTNNLHFMASVYVL